MANMEPTEPLIDSRLKELLEQLRQTPARDEEHARQGRKRFLVELDAGVVKKPDGSYSWLAGLFRPKNKNSEVNTVRTRTKLAFSFVMAAIVIVVFLFGGAGVTAFASQAALPGDALYPVKTGLEQTRVALAGNAYSQAQLNMRFAELRLEELAALIDEGRYGDIDQAAAQFEYHIQAALQSMQTVVAGDPALGAQLNTQISEALLRYAQALKSTWGAVPPQARPPLERMIHTSESGSDHDDDGQENEIEFTGVVEAMGATSWTVSGKVINITGGTEVKDSIQVGDTVKIHASQAADGSLTAREIGLDDGLIGDDDNDNGNDDNDNGNDDDVNDNGDDDNGSDDDDSGNDDEDNGNEDDDNGNDDEDNGNEDDDNGNDDDDNGNEDDDNGNDDDGNGNDHDDNGNEDGGKDDNDDHGGGDD